MKNTGIRSAAILPLTATAIFAIAACQPKPESPKGFALPEGDVVKGKIAFIELQCHRCHEISGVELPKPPEGPRIDVPLGGTVYHVKTYGELVTSIINPSHIIGPKYKNKDGITDENGKSIMPSHNDKMTVSQMIDLVGFLQSRYKLTHPDYDYSYYGM